MKKIETTLARIKYTIDFVNSTSDADEDDDQPGGLVALRKLYGEFGARWAQGIEDTAFKLTWHRANNWLDVALRWKTLTARDRKAVIEDVERELHDVVPGDGSRYRYDYGVERFEYVIEHPTARPAALVALALVPLFDDSDRTKRDRLGRCRYRNCRRYFFVVVGKLSGQRHCNPKHAALERQYRFRHRA